MMGRIRLGLIGCGGIAGAHAAAAAASDRVEVAAVVDPVASAREAMAETTGARAFVSVEGFLNAHAVSPVVDAAVVCTPPHARRDVIQALLAAGLPVLAEKPLAHTPEDADALTALAAQHPETPTAVAYCHRLTPALVEMKRLLADGKVGRPVRFENVFACWHPTLEGKWMSDPTQSGGGSLIDTGCHSLDLFGFLVGGVDRLRVEAALLHHGWAGRGETNSTVLVAAALHASDFAPGVLEQTNGHGLPQLPGVIASGWAEQDRFTVRLVGTAGALDYDFITAPETLRFTPSQGEPEDIAVANHELRFQHQLETFADLIEHPAADTPLARFVDAACVAHLVADAYAKAAPRQAVPSAEDAPSVTVRPVAVPPRTKAPA